MRTTRFIIFMVATVSTGCVYIDGEPDWSSRERVPIESFHTLVLDGGFGDIRVEVCRECEPAVFLEERPASPIASGSTLSITSGDPIALDSNDIKLITNDLQTVIINGTGDVRVNGVFTDEFTAINNGSGSVYAEGDARSVVISSTGSGPIDARRVAAKTVSVHLTGSGSAEVCAFQRLVGSVDGSGSVYYACHPDQVDVFGSGSGSVDPI